MACLWIKCILKNNITYNVNVRYINELDDENLFLKSNRKRYLQGLLYCNKWCTMKAFQLSNDTYWNWQFDNGLIKYWDLNVQFVLCYHTLITAVLLVYIWPIYANLLLTSVKLHVKYKLSCILWNISLKIIWV